MKECDKFVCDDTHQLLSTKEEGVYFGGIRREYVADLGELAAGLKPGRQNERERIFSMNMGIAVDEMVTAKIVYERALERGIGTRLPVVVPKTTEEVVRIAQIALTYEIPIVPFGGGTGMGGGTAAWKGGIIVETKGMNQVLEIDEKNLTATVQTGITIWELNEILAKRGLWLPHQPESKRSCTIGASIGCDNDSTFGLRYGKIKDCLTNAVMVTGRAEAVRVGQRKVFLLLDRVYKLLDLSGGL